MRSNLELDAITSTEMAKAAWEGYWINELNSDHPVYKLLKKDILDWDIISEADKKRWYYAAANVKDLLMSEGFIKE